MSAGERHNIRIIPVITPALRDDGRRWGQVMSKICATNLKDKEISIGGIAMYLPECRSPQRHGLGGAIDFGAV
ncbi:hypothetical protein [Chelativorans alearense]|uniref:hypothetical protein n=1 Tax=Chelativorans alearense TaxID=2681495 RepID=UPI0013D39D55|nr:hypothetical protein [Chelativorans alearense]